MSASPKMLRLGPLPKTESVKLTFACPVTLKADLDRYAAVHAQTYGEAVDATTLIPHMLEGVHRGGSGIQARQGRRQPTVFPHDCAEGVMIWVCCHYRIQATIDNTISN